MRTEKFFLWTESFDVHEPFHVPEPYRSMYTSDLNPKYTCWPPYQDEQRLAQFMDQASDGQIEYLRAQYAGKVTMVDTWLGRVFEALDRHNLWDETMVIITTDHGHDLGTNRRFGKEWPHYESHANIPLMIWHPEQKGRGRRVDALTAAVDLYPTILEALDHANVRSHDGRSLMPLIRGEAADHRDWVLYGTYSRAPRMGGAAISTRDWTLCQGSRRGAPYYAYGCTLGSLGDDLRQAEAGRFMPDVDIPMWRVPREAVECPSFLWDRSEQTLEPRNRMNEEPGKTDEMRQVLRSALAQVGCPPEQYERLGLT